MKKKRRGSGWKDRRASSGFACALDKSESLYHLTKFRDHNRLYNNETGPIFIRLLVGCAIQLDLNSFGRLANITDAHYPKPGAKHDTPGTRELQVERPQR
jgi:hypothetical protein